MAWVKLDDAMPHHPKVMAAGPQGFALDVAALCYANKHMTDGLILEGALPAVLPSLGNPKKWATRLVEVGRWEVVEGGWRISGYDEYQPTKAEQKAKQESLSDRGILGNHRRWHVGNPSPDCPYCDRRGDSDGNPPSRPDPSLPTSRAFAVFHRERVEALEKVRRAEDPARFAAWLVKQDDQVAESKRIWGHRGCERCGGAGVLSTYAPGAGNVTMPCVAVSGEGET